MAEGGPGGIELIERQAAVKNVAADKAEVALEVERRQDLSGDDGRLEARRVSLDRVDHHVGDLFAGLVPRPPVRQSRRDVLAEQ